MDLQAFGEIQIVLVICNLDPLAPNIVKPGFTGVYIFLLFLLKCSLELPQNDVTHNLMCTHNQCFEQNKKNMAAFNLKIVDFYTHKNNSLLQA